MMAQVTAAALVTENKVLAHPATVDSIPTSANKEDHVSMGMTAALKLRQVVDERAHRAGDRAAGGGAGASTCCGRSPRAPALEAVHALVRGGAPEVDQRFADVPRPRGGEALLGPPLDLPPRAARRSWAAAAGLAAGPRRQGRCANWNRCEPFDSETAPLFGLLLALEVAAATHPGRVRGYQLPPPRRAPRPHRQVLDDLPQEKCCGASTRRLDPGGGRRHGPRAGEVASRYRHRGRSLHHLARPTCTEKRTRRDRPGPRRHARPAQPRRRDSCGGGDDLLLAVWATMLTCGQSHRRQFFLAYVADARADLFVVRWNSSNRDETLVQQLVDQGSIEPRRRRRPLRHVPRHAGSVERNRALPADLHHLPLRKGDRLLLCSDRARATASRTPHRTDLAAGESPREAWRLEPLAAALAGAGPDKITRVVADVSLQKRSLSTVRKGDHGFLMSTMMPPRCRAALAASTRPVGSSLSVPAAERQASRNCCAGALRRARLGRARRQVEGPAARPRRPARDAGGVRGVAQAPHARGEPVCGALLRRRAIAEARKVPCRRFGHEARPRRRARGRPAEVAPL